MSEVIPVLSLFAGAGGMDLGFRKARLRPVLAIDNDAAAVKSYNLNAKRKTARCADLSSTTADEIIGWLSQASPVVHPRGIVGGPPCQGFSRGNAHKNARDPRNLLPIRFAEILEALNSWNSIDFFVFENVPGLKYRCHEDRFKRILRRFRKAGFHLFQDQINADAFGVAQRRRRLFLIGISKSLHNTSEFPFPRGDDSERTTRDAIAHLPDPVFRTASLKRRDIPYHPNHWTMPPVSKRFVSGDFNQGRSFRRLEWDRPSPTVAYGNREIHVHPNGKRRLTILEAMLLQGFPESYVLCGNFSQQVDQVSNAVPPPVAQALAHTIRNHLYSSD